MPINYSNSIPSQATYRTAIPLTNQVPNLSTVPGVQQDERFGFLPFIGGLALGGLLFDGFGNGRPCCGGNGGGGYAYPVYQQPVYQPVYYQQPVYMQPTYPVYQQQQQNTQTGYYGPYNPVMPSETTILENNKYYLS
ncbi:MAG: hypothetical protein K2G70_00520 [Turicibacter sp.]|nr:hypothetical protein [Turicibacter sp.]